MKWERCRAQVSILGSLVGGGFTQRYHAALNRRHPSPRHTVVKGKDQGSGTTRCKRVRVGGGWEAAQVSHEQRLQGGRVGSMPKRVLVGSRSPRRASRTRLCTHRTLHAHGHNAKLGRRAPRGQGPPDCTSCRTMRGGERVIINAQARGLSPWAVDPSPLNGVTTQAALPKSPWETTRR